MAGSVFSSSPLSSVQSLSVLPQSSYPSRRETVFLCLEVGESVDSHSALKDHFLLLVRRQMFLFVSHDPHLNADPPETQPVR